MHKNSSSSLVISAIPVAFTSSHAFSLSINVKFNGNPYICLDILYYYYYRIINILSFSLVLIVTSRCILKIPDNPILLHYLDPSLIGLVLHSILHSLLAF